MEWITNNYSYFDQTWSWPCNSISKPYYKYINLDLAFICGQGHIYSKTCLALHSRKKNHLQVRICKFTSSLLLTLLYVLSTLSHEQFPLSYPIHLYFFTFSLFSIHPIIYTHVITICKSLCTYTHASNHMYTIRPCMEKHMHTRPG